MACRAAHTTQVLHDMDTGSSVTVGPEKKTTGNSTSDGLANVLVEVKDVDEDEGPKDKMMSRSATVMRTIRTPWMERGLWWRLMHRTCNTMIKQRGINLVSRYGERLFGWAGHVAGVSYDDEICARAPMCIGSSGRGYIRRFKSHQWKGSVAREYGKRLEMVSQQMSESQRAGLVWLKTLLSGKDS